MSIKPIILCGGTGTRLWPESRKKLPKQFINFFGKDNLLDLTLNRRSFLKNIKEVVIKERLQFRSVTDAKAYLRMKYNMQKVYPYYRKAIVSFYDINQNLANKNRKRDKNKYLRHKHKELKGVFAKQLRNLTVSQGKLLISLIERERRRVVTVFDAATKCMLASHEESPALVYEYVYETIRLIEAAA